MKKSCVYCGKIHDSKIRCDKKPIYRRQSKEADRLRSAGAWKKAREFARQRDLNLCQWCLSEGRYNSDNLEVHHIIPVTQDATRAYDVGNLITLCRFHHELAERQGIPPGMLPEK